MITLARHPVVQRRIDDWQQSWQLPVESDKPLPAADDLRRLIASLEEALSSTSDQLDGIGSQSFKDLLRMNWQWIAQKLHAIISRFHQ